MDPQQLRDAFFVFAGAEQFRKFVVQLRADCEPSRVMASRKRTQMRFWQDELWNRFSKATVGATSDLEEIRKALLWCDVHRRHFEMGNAVADSIGVTDRDGNPINLEFESDRERYFPFGFGYWTLVCSECVEACRAWMHDAKLRKK